MQRKRSLALAAAPYRATAARQDGAPRWAAARQAAAAYHAAAAHRAPHRAAPMSIDKMKWKEVIDLLRLDEYKRFVQLELARDIEHWKKVTDIAPQSDQMMELFGYQAEYFLQKQSRQTKL